MTSEEIKALAQKYHTPGSIIRDDWHPVYQEECKKINRKAIEENLMQKYNVSGKAYKKTRVSSV